MKVHRAVGVMLMALIGPSYAAGAGQGYYLRLPLAKAEALGAIESIHVEVSCSWISGLRNVPGLYEIKMGYDVPMVNEFDAEPRLGSAAVDLAAWDGVIGVRVPPDVDSRSCFDVKVVVEGRSGTVLNLSGKQLGLPDMNRAETRKTRTN